MTEFNVTKKTINKYLRDIELAKSLSEKTMKAYKEDLYAFRIWLKTTEIVQIDQTHINIYFIYLAEERKNKSATLQRKYISIRAFFNHNDNYDCFKTKYRFITGKRLPKILSENEVLMLLGKLNYVLENTSSDYYRLIATRDNALIELLFSLGLRISEISNMKIEDYDMKSNSWLIKGKGEKERILYISNEIVRDKIMKWLKARENLNPRCDNLFINKYGNMFSIYGIENVYYKYRNLAKINAKSTPHYLRYHNLNKIQTYS